MPKITRIKARDSREDTATADEPTEKVAIVKATDDKKSAKKHKKIAVQKERATAKALRAQAKHDAKATAKDGHKRRIPVFSYIKESFQELRQVRWPNRKETWKMTVSVVIYVLAVALFIMLLDAGLAYAFNNLLRMGN